MGLPFLGRKGREMPDADGHNLSKFGRANPNRQDVDPAVISHWSVRDPEFQANAAEHLLDLQSSRGWPDGLRARYAYTATDGVGLMTYSPWAIGLAVDQNRAAEGVDRDLEGRRPWHNTSRYGQFSVVSLPGRIESDPTRLYRFGDV